MTNRWFVLPAIGVMIVIAGWFVVGGLLDNTVYYLFPDEAIERRADFSDGQRFRLGGLVAVGSISESDSGELRFEVTDGADSIEVRTTRTPPQLFQEDVSVLVEGFWEEDHFRADEVIIRHDENYDAPEGYQAEDSE